MRMNLLRALLLMIVTPAIALAIEPIPQPLRQLYLESELIVVADVLSVSRSFGPEFGLTKALLHPDTVLKKQIYSDCRAPRLWIVDSRYQNVEVYGTGAVGFRLESILASNHALSDAALSGASLAVADLFARA